MTLEDFTQAVERVVAGLEKKNRLLNPHEREVVAYHEAGHALVAMALPGVDPVQKISIIPRGIGALGYTMQRPLEDRFLMSKAELNNRLAVLLGGRVAEGLVFGEISTGAADDLAKATEIARDMVVRYGMDEQLGQVTYETGQSSFLQPHARTLEAPRYSDATASAIDRAVRDRIDAAARGAGEILQGRMEVLRRVAQALLTRETLSAEELRALTAIPPHQSPPPSGTEPMMPARPPTADAAC